jgi:ATP-dependent helicase/nuclease subunit B
MLGDALPYLGRQMKSPGSLDEIKSLISEFMLYDVDSDMLETMEKSAGEKTLLSAKLRDMRRLYSAFREYLSGHYMTGEESMDRLAELLCGYQRLRGSVVLLDGFTGFTPVQVKVLRELLKTASDVYVTVTADAAAFLPGKRQRTGCFL